MTTDAMFKMLYDGIGKVTDGLSGVQTEVKVLAEKSEGLDTRVTAHLKEHKETKRTFQRHALGFVFRIIGTGIIAAGGALVAIAAQ